MLTSLSLGAAGFLLGAAAFYFVHRDVFHSKKSSKTYKILFSKWNPLAPPARWGRAIHQNHHREHIRSRKTGEPEEMNMFFPWKVKLFVGACLFGMCMVSVPFAIGVVSFFPFYSYRHTAVHRVDSQGGKLKPWMRHHLYHHEKNPAVNHSGTLPFVDRVFGTHEDVPDTWDRT